MGCAYSKPELRARDDEVPQVSRRERRLWLRALSCCFKGYPARGYVPLTETLELEEPDLKEHGSPDHSQTRHEDLQQKLAEKEAEVQQSLEQHESETNELQTKTTDLEGQIAVLQGQITDLEDAKDRLMAAKEQELQDERTQLLKRIATQQEDHEKKIAEKEADIQHLQQSVKQHESELQTKITDLEGQIATLNSQISDLEDAKNKLIAAKEQELQDERTQLLKRITTQQEDHEKKIAENEADIQHLQHSHKQLKGQLLKVQAALPPAEQDKVVTTADLKDLDTELKTVHEWFRFGINLKVPDWKLLEIQENNRGVVDKCRLQVLIEWGKLEERTWRKVVRALVAVRMTRLARELAKKYGVPLPQNVDDISLQHMASTSTEEGQLQGSSQGVKEMEKEVADKEGLLKQSQYSEALVEREVKENMEILPQLQSQLKMVVHDKSNLEKQLETECRNSQLLRELYVLEHEKSQGRKEEVKELFASLIKEKEQQIRRLKDELEAKKKQITSLLQELEERKSELSQKTKELEEVTKLVQKLEGEKEQLRSRWVAKKRTLDRELQQQVAKTTSQVAYINQVKTRLSIAMEMVVLKDKEAADYRQQISQKEEEIAVLSERIRHQEAELHQIQVESRGTTVDQASSKETLEAFHKEVSQMVDTSELKMRLLRAEKEKQQLELKEETSLHEVVCHKKELSLDPTKCRAVGPGLESAKKHQLAHFEVHLVDAGGDTYKYITDSEISVQLKCLGDDSVTKANTTKKDQATYTVSYGPIKPGRYEIVVTVNDAPIHGSPFQVLVHNHPHPENCTAVGSGWELTETKEVTKFDVHLADIDGDPCVINQDVTAELKSIVDGSQVKAEVVTKSPAIYEVSYKPIIRGRHDLSVRVNGTPIQGSPFRVYVRQPPHLMSKPAMKIDTEHTIEDITTTRSGDLVVYGNNKLYFYTRGGQRIKTIRPDLPKDALLSLSSPSNRIAVDNSDNIYLVSNLYTHHLFKFNSTGKLEKSVGMEQEPGQAVNPSGIVLSKENKIYVCHCHRRNCRIQTFDTDLNFIGSFESGEINDPIDIAIDSDDNLYITDNGDGCVHVLSQSGTYLRKIGSQDQVWNVHVDHGWVYCTSLKNIINQSVQCHVYTTAGVFIGSFHCSVQVNYAKLLMSGIVSNLAIDEDGFVYIACSQSGTVFKGF